MGKKYIIEIPEDKIEDFVGSTHFLMPYMMAGHIGHHDTGLPIEPYTAPDLEQVRKEAYDNGYHEGHNACFETAKDIMEEKKNEAYRRGLSDAWECAKKIQDTGGNLNWWIHNTSASEAIEKIRQYEQEQEEIKVGDEVKTEDGMKMVIAALINKDFAGLGDDGRFMFGELDGTITRTGRHFPEIATVLEKMRGEQE